ncbi:hypothetical protein ACIQW9_14080 [Herminiimonas sp. NPDC097707]|uniref:hypothetical protein n=1 Tax=Herminiimonas sp. NPDC097707 TaxID=3364007 RepID=UPI00383B1930
MWPSSNSFFYSNPKHRLSILTAVFRIALHECAILERQIGKNFAKTAVRIYTYSKFLKNPSPEIYLPLPNHSIKNIPAELMYFHDVARGVITYFTSRHSATACMQHLKKSP